MNDIDLDALEATARAATPGPWGRATSATRDWALVLSASGTADEYRVSQSADDDDAEHIAAFDPPTVLALIARATEAFASHEGAPTWQDDPKGRDAALRWHMRGFEDGLNARRTVQGEPGKRAEWEAEQGETEWEYGTRCPIPECTEPHLLDEGDGPPQPEESLWRRTKARDVPAGEWVPVNENGETP